MPFSLPFCTTGVVPMARSGRSPPSRRSHPRARRGTSPSRHARFEPVGIGLRDHLRLRTGCADIRNVGAAFDQQPRDEQFGPFIARQRDRPVDAGSRARARPRMAGRNCVLRLRPPLSAGRPKASPMPASQASVPSCRPGQSRQSAARRPRNSRTRRCRRGGSPRPPRNRARHRARATHGRDDRTCRPDPAAPASAPIIIGSAGNISPRSVTVGGPRHPARDGPAGPASASAHRGIGQHGPGEDILGLGMGRHAEARERRCRRCARR
jgi:hypothetical protein